MQNLPSEYKTISDIIVMSAKKCCANLLFSNMFFVCFDNNGNKEELDAINININKILLFKFQFFAFYF